ncbi:MAG TPA: hypothetical protein VKZ91_12130 [Woeseiaceae bacterium]|nr:hypothetical protein [Woeseiaceae bacterium]
MPGKSPHSGHLTRSRSPVLPADADDIDLDLYRRLPATSPQLDGKVRPGQNRKQQSVPQAEPLRADRKFVNGPPPPSLLATELLRIEKVLDNHAADARQRDDLPRIWGR